MAEKLSDRLRDEAEYDDTHHFILLTEAANALDAAEARIAELERERDAEQKRANSIAQIVHEQGQELHRMSCIIEAMRAALKERVDD